MKRHLAALPRNLHRLFVIRCLVIIAMMSALGFSLLSLGLNLNYPLILAILSVLTLTNVMTWFRLRQSWPVTELEIFGQLLIDVTALGFLLFLSGGASNPFISYYLVPVCISAATLPLVYTWLTTGLSLGSYTLLLFFYIPLPVLAPEAHHHSGPNLHIIGMWCNFAISAILITYFVVRMAQDLRIQESQLNRHKEKNLRDEQVMAVATLAAGTAHELGTPLSTMMVLVEEMRNDDNVQPGSDLSNDLDVLAQQARLCRETLKKLVSKAEHANTESQSTQLRIMLESLLERWLVLRPDANCEIEVNSNTDLICAIDPAVEQSIMNLLNNAADANPENILIEAYCKNQTLHLDIFDNGPGIPEAIAHELGKPFVSTKGKGLGLGLFLSHASINRHGGTIKLLNRPEGGTKTEFRLPLIIE